MFKLFLHYLDERLGYKARKGLLLVDNCTAHPKDTSFLRHLWVAFLPASTTSQLLPLNAGIRKNVKHMHRKCIIWRFLTRVSQGNDTGKLSLPDAMHYQNTSWENATRQVRNFQKV